MFATSESDINVDQLMHEIRQTVARRQKMNALQSTAQAALTPVEDETETLPLVLQPSFVPHADNLYHVNDLLKYHGMDFVRNAYRAILKREPDEAGLSRHHTELANGRLNKIDILAGLLYSPEGRRAGVKVDGLKWPSLIRRIERAPVIGYVLQVGIGIARLPRLHRAQRQYEYHHAAQQQQIVDHSNRWHEELSKVLSQLSARATAIQEITAVQQQSIETLEGHLQELARRHTERASAVDIRFGQLVEALQENSAAFTAFARQIEEERAAVSERLTTMAGDLEETVKPLTQNVFAQEKRIAALFDAMHDLPRNGLAANVTSAVLEEEHHLFDALYAAFEDEFRGQFDEIKERLRVYLPLLKDANVTDGVLDVGCGRGEWLELLGDEGIQGHGVDHNRVFVSRCRELGLKVEQSDALAYLRTLPDGSLSAITSFHVVEHLSFETMIKLLDEMIRTLKPGGALILETPNPENFMVGSYNFYTDPTHRNPIPSTTLQFLLESRGLSQIKIMKLRPWDEAKLEGDTEIIKRFNEYFYSSPDYGIVGWKT